MIGGGVLVAGGGPRDVTGVIVWFVLQVQLLVMLGQIGFAHPLVNGSQAGMSGQVLGIISQRSFEFRFGLLQILTGQLVFLTIEGLSSPNRST